MSDPSNYTAFLENKRQLSGQFGFEPTFMPDSCFPFQRDLIQWAVVKGRAAMFADCGRRVIWKEPLMVRNRTMMKSLHHKTLCEDVTRCSIANADYLLMFRRSGDNTIPVTHSEGLYNYAGERGIPSNLIHLRGMQGDQKKNQFSQWIWRQYASSVWMDIRIDNVLAFREAKDRDDEKHVHPLQLDVIERACALWSNPGEVVLTPFMGVGSEVYGAVVNGRKGVGIELKPSYYRQAVANLKAAVESGTEATLL